MADAEAVARVLGELMPDAIHESNHHWTETYLEWSKSVFGKPLPVYIYEVQGVCSFSPKNDSRWIPVWDAMFKVELEICSELMADINKNNIPGDLIEFGVFEGTWLTILYDLSEQAGLIRTIWGLDSFRGLSKPHPTHDSNFWQEGTYAASLETVRKNVRADERSRFKFIEGFFSESLAGPEAGKIGAVCWARIDCDIYQPALESLEFLSNRLSHGAILVFDDWPHGVRQGEGLAFKEWVQTAPHLEFEFLFFGAWGHLYIRCWHRGKERRLPTKPIQ